jgi:hypothetical protein
MIDNCLLTVHIMYCIGGGTCDVTIAKIDGGVIEVISTAGNTHMGGEELDQCLVDHFAMVKSMNVVDTCLFITHIPISDRKVTTCDDTRD